MSGSLKQEKKTKQNSHGHIHTNVNTNNKRITDINQNINIIPVGAVGGRDNPQVGNEGASAVENHAQSFRQSHHPGERMWLRDYSAHYAIFQVGYSAFCGCEVGGKGFRQDGKAGGNWFQKRKEEGMKKKEN